MVCKYITYNLLSGTDSRIQTGRSAWSQTFFELKLWDFILHSSGKSTFFMLKLVKNSNKSVDRVQIQNFQNFKWNYSSAWFVHFFPDLYYVADFKHWLGVCLFTLSVDVMSSPEDCKCNHSDSAKTILSNETHPFNWLYNKSFVKPPMDVVLFKWIFLEHLMRSPHKNKEITAPRFLNEMKRCS